MNKRTIIIGDVHGCFHELNTLLERIKYNSSQDHVFFTGDLIGRGPHSLKTYLKFKELNAQSVLGNHELACIQAEFNGSNSYVATIKQDMKGYYADFLNDIKKFPLYIERKDFLLLHGGLFPYTKPQAMSIEDITTVREVSDIRSPYKKKPWFKFYKGNKLIVFGHWSLLGGVTRHNVIGLDTSCVYGGKLSSLLLPARKIIAVKAKKTY